MSDRLRCFIIMPYLNKSEWIYFEAIAPVLRELSGYDIMMFRADSMPSNITIEAQVEEAIQSAHFCIADVTENRPNVMYELGYARGINKPTVIIREKNAPLASNLSDKIVLEYSKDNIQEFIYMLSQACLQTIKKIELLHLNKEELINPNTVSVFPLTYSDNISEQLVGSVHNSLSVLVKSPINLSRKLLPSIESASHSKLTIRIIAANPEAEFVFAQARDLEIDVAQYRVKLWRGLETTREKLKKLGHQHSLRLTNNYFTNSIYLSDEIGILIPHLLTRRRSEEFQTVALQFERTKNSDMFRFLQRQFEQFWSTANSLPVKTPRIFMNDKDESLSDN